ncbi:MAG: L,D-transpeptidase [Chitinophagaceae bacterium]|nr:L,D-transpeptidase [Chitinophagaceae bacterium]
MRNRALIYLVVLSMCLFSFKNEGNQLSRRSFSTKLVGTPYIIVDKSDYEVQVYDDEGWYATYPAVFGNKSLGDKMMEGDRKTPEGNYKIVSKRPHAKWDKIMLLDYPTAADWQKFRERKAKGLIPAKATIGSGIAIHGTWQRDDMAVDYYQNWTNGCVSVKNEEIEELYEIIPIGTKVTIRK